jgi:hypothetical protein
MVAMEALADRAGTRQSFMNTGVLSVIGGCFLRIFSVYPGILMLWLLSGEELGFFRLIILAINTVVQNPCYCHKGIADKNAARNMKLRKLMRNTL